MFSKKAIGIVLVLALGLVGGVQADITTGLVGYWPLDGHTVDASGNGLDGTINGNVVPLMDRTGAADSAMLFDAEAVSYIDLGDRSEFQITGEMTLAAWVSLNSGTTNNGRIFTKFGLNNNKAWGLNIENDIDGVRYPATLQISPDGSEIIGVSDTQSLPTDEWVHVAGVYRPGQAMEIYVNGDLHAEKTTDVPMTQYTDNGGNARIGAWPLWDNCAWPGAIDEVRFYERALSADDIKELVLGQAELASEPDPAHDAIDIPVDALLSWTAGKCAATHDVYFGTHFDDVNAATRANPMDVLVSQGQAGTTFEPTALLEYGQTYYWRVDEVNAAPDNTIFTGNVWSFTVEPYAYPIADVIATSNVVCLANNGPENTVNDSGLNENDLHSIAADDMWLASPTAGESVWIQYEFDRIYKLHELWVWNYNVQFELALGFGVKEATIEYSEDGENWTTWGEVEFAQATARADYAQNTTVEMGGVAARYVRLNINSGWGVMGQYGLSEIRFLYIPTHACEPEPADGATDVSLGTSLTWRPGRDAIAHDVYVGTDPEAVELVASTDVPTYTPEDMAFASTYYWRIDEVNDAEMTPVWQGDLWSFSTPEFLVVDDFEGYNDDENLIYEAWIDGWVNASGSTVGYFEAPFAERTIVHGGNQSMPLFYDNSGLTTAEADLSLAQDWTVNGIKSLSLYFYGDPDNTGQLYLKINNATVTYDGDITTATWRPWNIDLSAVGGNLSNVSTLTIGIEGSGATGVVYIDDVRLYPRSPEFITPTDPGNEGLLLEYTFDNGASDSSGNGYDGTFLGDAHSADGVLVLDGDDDAVSVPRIGGEDAVFSQCSYSMWLYSTAEPASLPHTGGINSNGWSTGGIHCKISSGVANTGIYTLAGGDMRGATVADAGVWVHLALTVSDSQAAIYLNGQLEDSRSFDTPMTMILGEASVGAWYNASGEIVRELTGEMDNVRIYDRALSEAEILWLAGKRDAVYKPF